ncbi:MAG: hypothetical protein V3U75_01825 [Methylococcaceae bacterium]
MNRTETPSLAGTSNPDDLELLNAIKSTPTGQPLVCPCCNQMLPFQSLKWLEELPTLVSRHDGMGLEPDLVCMRLIERWGIYNWLSRLED